MCPRDGSLVVGPIEPATKRRRPSRPCAFSAAERASLAAATLRNISARGLQVEGEDLPPRETFVSLYIDGLVVPFRSIEHLHEALPIADAVLDPPKRYLPVSVKWSRAQLEAGRACRRSQSPCARERASASASD